MGVAEGDGGIKKFKNIYAPLSHIWLRLYNNGMCSFFFCFFFSESKIG